MSDEGLEALGGDGAGTPIREHPEPEAHVGPATDAREQPSVAGKAPPGVRLPQQDVWQRHRVVDIGADGEAPEHAGGVDEASDVGDPAGGAVGADHDVGAEADAAGQLEAFQPAVPEEGRGRPTHEGLSPGREGRRLQRLVEDGAGSREAMARIGDAGAAGQSDPPSGGPDDDHVADAPGPGDVDAEVIEELDTPRPDEVAAGLVAREPGLVGQRHPCSGARQHQGGDAPRRPRPDHEDVEALPGHPSSLSSAYCTDVAGAGAPKGGTARVQPPHPNRFAQELFTGLPARYDLLAELLSFGQNRRWRRAMVDRVVGGHPRTPGVVPATRHRILDVATGTAGVALQLARRSPGGIVGVDLTEAMLRRGQENVLRDGAEGRIHLVAGRAEQLPFPDQAFDALTFTYLLRYVADPAATLRELARVVKPGAPVASLEFSVPPRAFWRFWWWLYTRALLPAAS